MSPEEAPGIPERWAMGDDSADGSATRHPDRRELVDRSRARAWALQVHYRWESAGARESLRDVFVQITGTRRVARRRLPRIRRIVTALDEHLESVDAALEEVLENWRLDRLASIDRGVLRIGAVEILHMDDIPPKASIQEAVGLAEAYGGNESPRFVNGVLDAVWRRNRDRDAGG